MAGIKRDNADKWFSNCVRERVNYTCECCGKYFPEDSRRGIECAHIIGRRVKRLRQHPDNAVCLCTACHMHFSGQPIEFTRFITNKIGEGLIDILHELARELIKYNKAFVEDCAAHYKEQFEIMQEKRKQGDMGRIEFEGFL